MQPTWQTEDGAVALYLGDCLDVLPEIDGVDGVVTSPPYAQQRAACYGGIPVDEYPDWTTKWLDLLPLSSEGSVLVNIREHRDENGMSDYVHRTRLAVRSQGWREVDEIVWIKPDAMPTAPNNLPRRGWERVLWFSKTSQPACNATENRKLNGFNKTLNRYVEKAGIRGTGSEKMPECPRKLNYVSVSLGNDVSTDHPAKYPAKLAQWLVSLLPGTILDPFMGSGTTGVACLRTGRRFIGVEKEPKYFDIAVKRIEAELNRTPLFEPPPKITQRELIETN